MRNVFSLFISVAGYLVWIGAVLIHFWTVYIAYTISGFFWGIITFFSPFFAQVYWGYRSWSISGFESPYLQWLIVVVVAWILIMILIMGFGVVEKKRELAATTLIVDGNEIKNYHYYGFGGWLILFSAGLVIACWRSFDYVINGLYPISFDGTLTELVKINSMWGVLFLVEWVFNIGLITLILLVGYFCLKQLRLFKKVSIILLIFNLSMTVILYFLYLTVPETAEQSSGMLKVVLQSFVYTAIWWPYFIKSRRVNNTFIK